jgi:hypothetical protein
MTQTLPWLALGVALFALLVMLFMSMGQARRAKEQAHRLDTMQNDLRALCNAAVQVGERANKLELSMKLLQQRQKELGVRQEQMGLAEPEARSYDQAIKLAQKGTSLEEIMDICDLSRGEAELIVMMHRLERA